MLNGLRNPIWSFPTDVFDDTLRNATTFFSDWPQSSKTSHDLHYHNTAVVVARNDEITRWIHAISRMQITVDVVNKSFTWTITLSLVVELNTNYYD